MKDVAGKYTIHDTRNENGQYERKKVAINKRNTDKFKDVEARAVYSQETNNNLEQQSDNGNSSITQIWERIEAAIAPAANKIIGDNTNKRMVQ
jgi:hypothetical protein